MYWVSLVRELHLRNWVPHAAEMSRIHTIAGSLLFDS